MADDSHLGDFGTGTAPTSQNFMPSTVSPVTTGLEDPTWEKYIAKDKSHNAGLRLLAI